ncbi:hypothetical protein [Luteipulveratus flavus]|uniref:Uncharacterized protein n=1 Tax=Luteipulveratus flavus TaxID=3031728 RepID=A0ABT6C2D8_9MICO|nr:hypothetical protein [Luteipulveratus sp. YIM 133296]MDF8263099.1 hypothetical protein [Luteipulveratus sp. YIM 133296]
MATTGTGDPTGVAMVELIATVIAIVLGGYADLCVQHAVIVVVPSGSCAVT